MPLTFRKIFVLTTLLLLLAACSQNPPPASTTPPDASAPTAQPRSALKIEDVVFTHKLNDDMTPSDETDAFEPDQEVYMSVKLDGNPKKGLIAAAYSYNGQDIADAQVDLARARDDQGVIFVIGGNTYVGFTLSHETPFPPSPNYRVTLALDGEPAGEYAFTITPPEDAIPSRLITATLATDVKADSYEPYEPTDTFPADKQVFLAGRVELGKFSTLTARWYIDGKLDEAGTRIITASEDVPDTGFYFTYLPEDNWPEGKHKVVLSIDDEPAGEYEFTITPAP